ncbi:MAG: hypothetical protein ABI689_15675 [Thermoanaerobaculia bacterium]
MKTPATRNAALLAIAGCCAILVATLGSAPALAADAVAPDPGAIVTAGDVQKVLGGKWKARVPEPGVLFYEEDGTGYRTVQVYLRPANGRDVESLKSELVQQGEPVEDVPGVGESAIYRPQRQEATTEKTDKSGELYSLTIAVREATAADTKKFAVELAKRGAERI